METKKHGEMEKLADVIVEKLKSGRYGVFTEIAAEDDGTDTEDTRRVLNDKVDLDLLVNVNCPSCGKLIHVCIEIGPRQLVEKRVYEQWEDVDGKYADAVLNEADITPWPGRVTLPVE